MQYIKLDEIIQKNVKNSINNQSRCSLILQEMCKQQARPLLVGGAVRDALLGLSIKDLDFEIHHLDFDDLHRILSQFGDVVVAGKSFGVLKVAGVNADWSLPRRDSSGRKPQVVLDKHLSIEDAFKRRDLTINAMGIDMQTYELIDPFNGLQDLQEKILRAPDLDFFVQDPLRFFRVMQFVARFEMQPDIALNTVCSSMDISAVSAERIEQEFNKMILKSKKPSLGIAWLDQIGRLSEVLPELALTKKVPQDPRWHPEGDVFEHSKQAFDAAVQLDYAQDEKKIIMAYAALCHDLGKVYTTHIDADGIHSIEHAQEGVFLATKLLKRVTRTIDRIRAICKLIANHMHPFQLVEQQSSLAAYKRLANKLLPVSLHDLAQLALADKRARNPERGNPLASAIPAVDEFIARAQQAGVFFNPEKPILNGADLLDILPSGPQLGKALEKAYERQIDKGISDKEQLKGYVAKLVGQGFFNK